jgi:flagellar hook-associated protein 1
MAGLTVSLYTAAQTLQNTQLELQTASSNISNASTTGYATETAAQTDNQPIDTMSGWLGTGASVTHITQARDQFLEQQLMNAMSGDSQYASLSSQLTSIQSACADSGSDGISAALGNFFNAWNTLTQAPTGLSQQTGVYSAAQGLASAVQSTYDQLNQIANQMPGQINDTINQADSLISQIAQLNVAIAQNQTSTNQPNNLIDEQYEAMDSLAKLIPVSFSQDPATGMMTVTTTDATGPGVPVVTGAVGTPLTTPSTITGGQLGALLTAQTDLTGATGYVSQLNTFASTLISQVNTISTDNGGTAVFNGADASSIVATNNFMSGQTSAELTSTAQAMSQLQDNPITFTDGTNSTTATPEEYLSNIQQNVGDDVQQANNNQSFYDSLQSQLQKQQQSVSGVSVDQEMISVIQDQQVYEAAAKVVSTVDTLMSTTINMVNQ